MLRNLTCSCFLLPRPLGQRNPRPLGQSAPSCSAHIPHSPASGVCPASHSQRSSESPLEASNLTNNKARKTAANGHEPHLEKDLKTFLGSFGALTDLFTGMEKLLGQERHFSRHWVLGCEIAIPCEGFWSAFDHPWAGGQLAWQRGSHKHGTHRKLQSWNNALRSLLSTID